MPDNVSILPFLEEGPTIPAIADNYAKKLREDRMSFRNILHANKLEEYEEMISDIEFLTKVKKEFDNIFDIMVEMGFYFVLEGRRKSFYSLLNKNLLLLSKTSSLDLIRDIFAFRLVLFDSHSPQETIANLYKAMERIIIHLNYEGFIVCESKATVEDASFNQEAHPKIYVPETTILKDEFRDYVKDYVWKPKYNGYQSLHASFRDSRTGRCFEIQIRSATMHIYAEPSKEEDSNDDMEKTANRTNESADHTAYKKKKYAEVIETWDLSKVNVNGFYYQGKRRVPNPHSWFPYEAYQDFVGLIDSLIIFSRRHTF